MSTQTQKATVKIPGEDETNLNLAELNINAKDRAVLRRLATQVAEIAAQPIEQEKRDLWYRHNALEPTRPVIFCDPENGWNEIITPDQLECEGKWARQWEKLLRKEIFWGAKLCDDRVIVPYFNVPYVYTETDWGMHETKIGGHAGGAYTWDSPLKNYDDLNQLHFPQITVDYEATDRLLDLANDIVFKGATVQGISGRRMYQTWYQTRALLNSGAVQVDPLITHHFLFEEESFEKGMELMNAGRCGKVVLYLDEAEMEAAAKKRQERQAKAES